MSLLASIRAASARVAGAAGRFAHAYVRGGPVGVFYALKLAHLKRRMAEVRTYIHRENELHRAHLSALHQELTDLIDQHQSTNVAAREFWRTDAGAEAQS